MRLLSIASLTAAFAALSLAAVGCSAAGPGSSTEAPLPEHTGAISAKLANIPSDVQCIEIRTSDSMTPFVMIDVAQGQSITTRIAPLAAGYVQISGNAYNRPCYAAGPIEYPGNPMPTYDAGSPYPGDAGPTNDGGPTWTADPIWVDVIPGQTTEAQLRFHQPGGVDLTIDFDNCLPDAGSFCGGDIDGGPPVYPDSGPIPSWDAGAAH